MDAGGKESFILNVQKDVKTAPSLVLFAVQALVSAELSERLVKKRMRVIDQDEGP